MSTATQNRRNPIGHPLSDPSGTLSLIDDLVKVGAKGRGLAAWSQNRGLPLPASLYDVQRIGERGLLARVGTEELVLECDPNDPFLSQFEQALRAENTCIYRIEQQGVTIELRGPRALDVFAQTCGVNMIEEPEGKILYTRVAGVACGISVLSDAGGRYYRLWADYSFAPALIESLHEIVRDL